jgi:hypothetical protein
MRHLVKIVNGDTYTHTHTQAKKKKREREIRRERRRDRERKRFKPWRETSVFCPSSILLVFLILPLGYTYERKLNVLLLRGLFIYACRCCSQVRGITVSSLMLSLL